MEQKRQLHTELLALNNQIFRLGAMVEERVRSAVEIIQTLDLDEVDNIIALDEEIDEMEVIIEEHCLKILALYQPMASDLRFIVTAIKINNELERIADMAVGIARRVRTIAETHHNNGRVPFDFIPMSEQVLVMLKKSLDALVNRDSALAKTIFRDDKVVDATRNDCYKHVKTLLMEDPTNPGYYINTYLLSRHLERIADRAINIAEEVIHLVDGKITRFS